MTTVQLKVPFDDRVILGREVMLAITDGLKAQGIDCENSILELDPVTGKTRCVLDIPESASEVGKTTAGGVSGVASPFVVPPPLFMLDCENAVFATLVLQTIASLSAGQRCIVAMANPTTGGTRNLGNITGDGASNTYNDGGANTNPTSTSHASINFQNFGSGAVVIPAGDLTLTFDGAQTQQLLNAAPINIAASSVGQASTLALWIDVNGLLYVKQEGKDGVVTTPFTPYDSAVRNNPTGL